MTNPFMRILRGITKAHKEKKTLAIVVNVPEHKDRTTTSLFRHSREELKLKTPQFLFQAEPGRCFICGKTEEELGAPLQAHHFGIERCFAEGDINWDIVKKDFPDFDWDKFDPKDPYSFVDDMTAQGLMLCEEHHIGRDTGIHNLTFSLWIMQRYLKSGYKYSPKEVLDSDAMR